MTWSYSGDPSTSPKDAVRLKIGDIIETPASMQLLQDEEIQYFLDLHDDDILAASIACVNALLAKFARYVDEVTGDLQRKYSQRFQQFKQLKDQLDDELANRALTNPIPFAGGIDIDDMQARSEDPNRYPDIFRIGQNDECELP